MRIPLYLKVMVSYLLVVGLVFLPTVFYIQRGVSGETEGVLVEVLGRDLELSARRLGEATPDGMRDVVAELLRNTPHRLTVVSADGSLVADTPGFPAESLKSQPEIREALETGVGFARRTSEGTKQDTVYGAQRFPAAGSPRGVVRVALPARSIEAAEGRIRAFTNVSGAVALTASVLLSLLAALAVSRPLRRLAETARAFAAGDFGFPVQVRSADELGEVAAALEDLGAEVRDRLLEAGAGQVTLRALLDELPMGVILFDGDRGVVGLNGRARELCALSVDAEVDDARRILDLKDQALVVRRVLERRVSEDAVLVLPWRPRPRLLVRWVPVVAKDGKPIPAALISEEDPAPTESLIRSRGRWLEALQNLALGIEAPEQARSLLSLCDELDRVLPRVAPRAQEICALPLSDAVGRAQKLYATGWPERAARLEVELDHPDVRVTEGSGRLQSALFRLLRHSLDQNGNNGSLRLRDELQASTVRLVLYSSGKATAPEGLAELIGPLGGDAGVSQAHDGTELWLIVPRA